MFTIYIFVDISQANTSLKQEESDQYSGSSSQNPSIESFQTPSSKRKQHASKEKATFSQKKTAKIRRRLEVAALLAHKEIDSEYKYLVQWNNSWVFERNLSCPALLQKYKKQIKVSPKKNM